MCDCCEGNMPSLLGLLYEYLSTVFVQCHEYLAAFIELNLHLTTGNGIIQTSAHDTCLSLPGKFILGHTDCHLHNKHFLLLLRFLPQTMDCFTSNLEFVLEFQSQRRSY